MSLTGFRRLCLALGLTLFALSLVACSSNCDPLSPFGIVQRALLRESHTVKDVATAIELVTRNAAYAVGIDGVTGSLEVGKQADFVVLIGILSRLSLGRLRTRRFL